MKIKDPAQRRGLVTARRVIKRFRTMIIDAGTMPLRDADGALTDKPDMSTLDDQPKRDVRECDRALAAIDKALR